MKKGSRTKTPPPVADSPGEHSDYPDYPQCFAAGGGDQHQ